MLRFITAQRGERYVVQPLPVQKMAIKATGSNEIELTYEIPYLREGLYISAAALAVMLIDALCRWAGTRKKKKAAR